MTRSMMTLPMLMLLGSIANRAMAAGDIKVCVDVALHAPQSKATTKGTTLDSDAPSARKSADDAGAPSTAPNAADGNQKPTNESPAEPAVMVPYAVPVRVGEPRVLPVDHTAAAEEAATVASEVDPQGTQDPRVKSGAHLPVGQTPVAYLKRLIEHFVTHEPRYIASQDACAQRISVELYPLKAGWTAFARYSGTGREERVDQLLPTELSQFAERSVLALLHDVPIGMTVDRDNVLWADSLKSTQRIRGRNHFVLGVGTHLRAGYLDTLDKSNNDNVMEQLRLFTPMALSLGYRGQFDQFGVEAMTEIDISAEQRGIGGNPSGGHVDYGGTAGILLHVLRYTNPRGLASPYFGAGANFALHWFRAITPELNRYGINRSTLFGGGLDVDMVGGYEFMRASAVSFFLQGELNLPAYVVRSENNDGQINTWFPGAALRLGASF